MSKKERLKLLDSILLFLQDRSIEESPVWYLDKIDFLKNIDTKTLIEFQSTLYKDSYVQTSTIHTSKKVPIKITTSGINFISKGGYIASWRKERNEKLKSTIILSGVIFSILVGIISTTLSVINYKDSKNKQDLKIEKLQEQMNYNNTEIEKLKNRIEPDSIIKNVP